jgi:Chitobiase/beta-hexosaminidase C-terminal domain
MARGLNRGGDFRSGNPVTLPKNFGNQVDWSPKPSEFGNPQNQSASPTNFGNPVTWIPDSSNYGNRVGGVPTIPTFYPAAGTYGVPQMVKIIADADQIYFTLDGTTPDTNSRLYTGNVFISKSETLTAISVIGGIVSAPGSAAYIITNP